MTETVHEMTGVQIPRVDAVDDPAHGLPFLIAKSRGSAPTAMDTAVDAIRVVHQAALRARTKPPLVDEAALAADVIKGKYNAEQLREMGGKGQAFKNADGTYSYPIADAADVSNAVRAVGRGNSSHDAIRRYIIGRAKTLGASDKIPDDWSANGSIKKEMGDVDEALTELANTDEIGQADANEEAAGTMESTHAGDADDPGSAAWEAVDAAKARGVTETLVQLRRVIQELQDREATEVATGVDESPMIAGCDTGMALDALDCAIRSMANFAVTEQGEANAAADEVAAQAEALGIAKSEGANVDGAQPVEKADASPDDQIIELMMKLAKTVPDNAAAQAFLAVANTTPAAPADDSAAETEAPDPAAPATVENAAPPEHKTVVAPGAEAPAVAAPPAPPTAPDNEYVQKALTTQKAELEALFKAELKATVGPLQELVQKMAGTPRPGGPLVNGHTPDADPTRTRGHDAGVQDPYDQVRKSLQTITDPEERNLAALEVSQRLMKSILTGESR